MSLRWRVFLGAASTLFLGSLACTSLPGYSTPTFTSTITTTPTITGTPTDTPTATSTSRPTRTATPTLIPGIEAPIKLGTAKVTVTNAIRRDNFECGSESSPVATPGTDEWLIIDLTVVSGGQVPGNDVQNWFTNNHIKEMRIQDDAQNYSKYTHACVYRNQSTGPITELLLPFEVKKSARSFTLILADDTRIPLDSFL